MAPALAVTSREHHSYDLEVINDADKPLSHRRRALTSVDNCSASMDEDDMGLQNQPNLVKDSQEMEQILVDLGNSDLAPDLLQAIKNFDSGGDTLSTGDPDAIFPLSGFDLADTADSEGDVTEDKMRLLQARLERRCSFLQRRLRILQARTIGKKISEEVALTFDKCSRSTRKDGSGGRLLGVKTLLKKIETTSALQASASSRTIVGPRYYHAGTSKGDASRSASIGIQSGTLAGLEDTAGALHSHLSVVKHELDSDATLSSSGAESNDEVVTYNNPHQQHMPIEKRALWSWQKERAAIASRWCWLQAQVQELDYKIRQQNDLHKQVRAAKGTIEFEGQPVGYEGTLPGSELADDDPALETCARHRPLRREVFKKRKLLQMHNLHIATTKASKPSDIRCSCQFPIENCSVCTGRAEPTQPLPPHSTLSPGQRVALADPGYHSVLSDVRDISSSVHMSALTARTWFRSRLVKSWRGAHHGTPRLPPATHSAIKPPKRPSTSGPSSRPGRRGRPPLTRKVKEREKEKEEESASSLPIERPRGRSSTETRTSRQQSYDIDNIVIPQSLAANTRPEILTYKEIITPKWRVLEIPQVSLNNGVMKSSCNRLSLESDEEDVSDANVNSRHARAEAAERGQFLRRPRARRVDAATQDHQEEEEVSEGSTEERGVLPRRRSRRGEQLPSEALPSNPALPQASADHETVRPYTPRQFPLREETYINMLSLMPPEFRPSSPEMSPLRLEDPDDESTLSPLSPTMFDGDDPDDAEWDPSVERVEKRKMSFK